MSLRFFLMPHNGLAMPCAEISGTKVFGLEQDKAKAVFEN
jgi:hypothetical protein